MSTDCPGRRCSPRSSGFWRPQLLMRNAFVEQQLDLGIERGFDLLERCSGYWRRVDAEGRRIERRALIPGARAGRDALLDDQRAVEPAVRAAAEHIGKQVDRLALGILCTGIGRHEVTALHARLGDAQVRKGHAPLDNLRGLLRALAWAD